VDETCRDDCITAINDFKAEHPADVVVCSRIADYEKLRVFSINCGKLARHPQVYYTSVKLAEGETWGCAKIVSRSHWDCLSFEF
jgi:hypothetical protein